jgi:SAM-dependent methyltransferase
MSGAGCALSQNKRMTSAADQWAEALAAWGIPDDILAQAPSTPWIHPPKMFRSTGRDPSNTPSMRAASDMLGAGGTVLDVGCGGGRSSLPLGGLLHHAIGADEQPEMLDQFTEAAALRGIASSTVLGRWPAAAADCPVADVVVSHHVVYNVAPIRQFVEALDTHAKAGVVVELPERHPQSPLNDLWAKFWGITRPTEPSSDLFVEVVREIGRTPTVVVGPRPNRPAQVNRPDLVSFVRQRLCLSADRDPEIDQALGARPKLNADTVVTVSWRTNL